MADTSPAAGRHTTRRTVLGSAGVVLASLTSGCVQRFRSLVNRQSPNELSLTVKTVPADDDEAATKIARELAANLNAVGIDTDIQLMAEDELLRDLLANNEFDIYVARHPGESDPDFLRPLLHSSFAGEPGWQNPFGFSDLAVDDLLGRQRRLGGQPRHSVVSDLQREVVRQQPFAVVGFPDWIGAVRTDRFAGWREFAPDSPLRYVTLDPVADEQDWAGSTDLEQLTVTLTDDRATRNLNPIAVEFRAGGPMTGLLYDSIGRRYDGAIRPWLAESWTWRASPEDGLSATVRLREGLTWHDGRPLTADDVAFTYRFLADTSLTNEEATVPAPRFRGAISMVDQVVELDDHTLGFQFGDTSTEVGAQAFAVPVLPRHEWEPKARDADLVGFDLFDGVTEALVWPNPEPIGSGPLRFERAEPEQRLVLTRFDDHFIVRETADDSLDRFGGGPAFERFVARVAPSDEVAVDMVGEGEADATVSSLDPAVVPRIGHLDEVTLLVHPHRSFYHVGFNVRRDPLGNPRFRRAVARLLDKSRLVEDVLGGYASPAASPLGTTTWTPTDLEWDDGDPVLSFIGSAGDLDVPAARRVFREAGYRYSDGGVLLEQ